MHVSEKLSSSPLIQDEIDIVSMTASMMLTQVELSIDRNFLYNNKRLDCEPHNLVNTLRMPINMLRSQAEKSKVQLVFEHQDDLYVLVD